MFIKLFISILGLLFVIESRFDLIQANYSSMQFPGEFSLLAILQSLIIFFTLIINLKFRKIFINFSSKTIFSLRVGMFAFLLYEENSFITKGLKNFATSINSQGEVNLHNISFLKNLVFSNNYFSLSYETLFFSLCLLFVGYGSYIKVLNKFKILFLERKFSFYFILYFVIEIINSVYSTSFSNGSILIAHEFLEFIIYIILLIDSIEKISTLRKKYNLIK